MWGMAQGRARRARSGEERLAASLDGIASVLGHASRAASARAYCTGLLLPGERRSVEPMAARLAPAQVQAKHQSLHHVVAEAAWDDAAVLRAVREQALPAIARHGPVRHWVIDGTGLPKQGRHSVGVARQYCGALGKQGNCQVAVSLSVANEHASLPIACRLYLPEAWAADAERRAQAGVVLGDAGYGDDTDFRVGVGDPGLRYVLGIRSATSVWPPGQAPLPPGPWSGRGRPPTRLRRSPEHQPVAVKDLAVGLPARAWRAVTWREGGRAALTSRFAAVRVRPAHRDRPAQRALAGGMAADRVARGRGGAEQILALQPAAAQRVARPGPRRQGALGDRARLSGAEAGDRVGPPRGPRLARLPPPRQSLHRGLRLPRRRAPPFPPSAALRASAAQGTCATRGLPAARRHRRLGLSGTCRAPSPRSGAASRPLSSAACPDARAACSSRPQSSIE